MRVQDSLLSRSRRRRGGPPRARLEVERLEGRELLTATPSLTGNVLTVLGGPSNDRISVLLDPTGTQLVVYDSGEVGAFASAAVATININSGDGNDFVFVGPGIVQDVTIQGGNPSSRFGPGGDVFVDLSSGTGNVIGGAGNDRLVGGPGNDILNGAGGRNLLNGLGGPGQNILIGGPQGPNAYYGDAAFTTAVDPKPGDLVALGQGVGSLFNDPFFGLTPTRR